MSKPSARNDHILEKTQGKKIKSHMRKCTSVSVLTQNKTFNFGKGPTSLAREAICPLV